MNYGERHRPQYFTTNDHPGKHLCAAHRSLDKSLRQRQSDNAGFVNLHSYTLLLLISSFSPQCISDRCQPLIAFCSQVTSWLGTFKLELCCNLQSLRAKCDIITILDCAFTPTWSSLTSHVSLSCVYFAYVTVIAWRFTSRMLLLLLFRQETQTKTGESHQCV